MPTLLMNHPTGKIGMDGLEHIEEESRPILINRLKSVLSLYGVYKTLVFEDGSSDNPRYVFNREGYPQLFDPFYYILSNGFWWQFSEATMSGYALPKNGPVLFWLKRKTSCWY